jgi:hypothetical protein
MKVPEAAKGKENEKGNTKRNAKAKAATENKYELRRFG